MSGHADAGRIERRFAELRSRGERALIPFVTAGDPSLEVTRRLVLAAAEAGADVVELGIPFSDPLLDGPVIQAASQRALDRATRVPAVFEMVQEIRRTSQVPLIFMTCLNPICRAGMEAFARRSKEAGMDGVLVTDLPPEEGHQWFDVARTHDLDRVLMLAPTSSAARIAAVGRTASGFLYCQSRAGVTGLRTFVPPDLGELVGRVRQAASLPIGVGFGISTPEHVKAVTSLADAAVVGTAFVRLVEQHQEDADAMVAAVTALTSTLKAATRG